MTSNHKDPSTMTNKDPELLPCQVTATPEQIERANKAVAVNLNADGSPVYDSAQGYACALTAIIQTDAAMNTASTIPTDAAKIVRELRGPLPMDDIGNHISITHLTMLHEDAANLIDRLSIQTISGKREAQLVEALKRAREALRDEDRSTHYIDELVDQGERG